MSKLKFFEIADEAVELALDGDKLNMTKFVEIYGTMIVNRCSEIARLNTREDSKVNLMIKEHFGVDDATR